MGWECKGVSNGVDDPSQDYLLGYPRIIDFEDLGDGDGLFSVGIGFIIRTED